MASEKKVVAEVRAGYETPERGPSLGPIVSGAWLKSIRRLHSLIMAGFLPSPGLVTYSEWGSWRAGPGCRPRRPEGNTALEEIFEHREEELHCQLMKDLFGDRWEVQLRQQRLAKERWEEVQRESEGEGIARRKGPHGGPCPRIGTQEEKKRQLDVAGARQGWPVHHPEGVHGTVVRSGTRQCRTRQEEPPRGPLRQGVEEERAEQCPRRMTEGGAKKCEGSPGMVVLDEDAWGSEFGSILKGIQEQELAFRIKAQVGAPSVKVWQEHLDQKEKVGRRKDYVREVGRGGEKRGILTS